ncbi:hydroxycarboxylic acid receptor 2-like [Boleophthalmus pectinirostris]|uniref:hydroxycarboxylic acid receptor 2-like n=1 Tax=Boleophthalmus pectinirostris TaxID=150288 RepID=UPI00242E7708|nr:hydroxycarboxylic acid receptor 2-like [Boleophthalmus pectinirostris]XP_055018677.1 hydroxycarboxylic acid receptor 2-like [Boleophthalmus pectinirostris]
MSNVSMSDDCYYPKGTWTCFVFLVMIVTVGLPGNILALWIFCFRMKIWKSHTIFLFNLMLADFLLLACVPFRIDTHLRDEHWIYGEIFCRINLFMLAVNRSASIAFMTVVALNRYFKVLHPMNCVSLMSSRHAVWLSPLIWLVVIICRVPLLTTDLLQHQGNRSMCRSFGFPRPPLAITVHYIAYVIEFILPWFVLLFCSARIIWYLKRQEQIIQQKKFKKAIQSVAVINLVFTVCFLPAIITGLGSLVLKRFRPQDCEVIRKMSLAFMVSIGVTYLNSALDPVIYTFSSSMFRTALRNVFKDVKK